MKRIFPNWMLLAAVAVALGACQKQSAVNEMEKAAVALEKTDKDQPAPVVEPGAAPAGPPPAQQVKEALADYKAGKMEDAVTRLQLLRSVSTISPQQRMALQDSVAALMTEIYGLAEKGDPRAIAAVKQYEAMQTARH